MNGDVSVLNTKTWTWSTLEIHNTHSKPVSIHLYGHSMVLDPHNDGQLIIFGGKEVGDWRGVSDPTHNSSHSLSSVNRKRVIRNRSLLLNINTCTLSAWKMKCEIPEARYGHSCVAVAPYPKSESLNTKSLRKSSMASSVASPSSLSGQQEEDGKEEVVMYLFGGTKATQGGFCAPDLHVLIRRQHKQSESSHNLSSQSMHDDKDTQSMGDSQYQSLLLAMRPSSPSDDEDESPAQLLLRQASQGKMDRSYGDIKKALMKSVSTRIIGPMVRRPSIKSLSSTSSLHSSRRTSLHSKRYVTTTEKGGNRDLNGTAIGSGGKSKHSNDVATELPAIVKGLSLVQAKARYDKLHPVPTRKSVFGDEKVDMFTLITTTKNSSSSRIHALNSISMKTL